MACFVFLLHAFLWFFRRVVLCDFLYGIIKLIASFVQGVHLRQVAFLIEAVLRAFEEVYFIGLAAFLHSHCLHFRLTVSLETCQRSLVELHHRIFGDKRAFFLGIADIDKGIVALSILVVVEILSLPYDFNLVLLVELL